MPDEFLTNEAKTPVLTECGEMFETAQGHSALVQSFRQHARPGNRPLQEMTEVDKAPKRIILRPNPRKEKHPRCVPPPYRGGTGQTGRQGSGETTEQGKKQHAYVY